MTTRIKQEPVVALGELILKPSLAKYVIKRHKIHSEEVIQHAIFIDEEIDDKK